MNTLHQYNIFILKYTFSLLCILLLNDCFTENVNAASVKSLAREQLFPSLPKLPTGLPQLPTQIPTGLPQPPTQTSSSLPQSSTQTKPAVWSDDDNLMYQRFITCFNRKNELRDLQIRKQLIAYRQQVLKTIPLAVSVLFVDY